MGSKKGKVLGLVRSWFDIHEVGGLILPSGWFGRPYDMSFPLQEINEEDNQVKVDFDSEHSLTFLGEIEVNCDGDDIIISNFDSCVFLWMNYDDEKLHQDTYFDGIVKIVHI